VMSEELDIAAVHHLFDIARPNALTGDPLKAALAELYDATQLHFKRLPKHLTGLEFTNVRSPQRTVRHTCQSRCWDEDRRHTLVPRPPRREGTDARRLLWSGGKNRRFHLQRSAAKEGWSLKGRLKHLPRTWQRLFFSFLKGVCAFVPFLNCFTSH
jgi:hypothetical protein